MMAGVLATSIVSGQLISRIGRYRPFPIAGTALMTVGPAAAVAPGDRHARRGSRPRTCCVLGLGLGMVMQVLVLAVQNAVDYRDLGVATSGSTLFRSIGGSIGVAVFGAIFANRLAGRARRAAAAAAPPGAGGRDARRRCTQLPAAVQRAVRGRVRRRAAARVPHGGGASR